MLELLMSGGWVMLPLLILAVVATAIALERFWTLRRSEVIPHGIGLEIEHWSRGKTLEIGEIQRLRQDSQMPDEMPDTLQAFGINKGVRSGFAELFASHPPLEQRIEALQQGTYLR